MPPKVPVRKRLKETNDGPKVILVKPSDTVQKTVNKCIRDFRSRFHGANIFQFNTAERAIRRLQARCCWAHHELATVSPVIVQLDCLLGGRDYTVHLVRDRAFPNDSDWEGLESYVRIPELPPPRFEDARNLRAPPGFEAAVHRLAGRDNGPVPPPEEEQADEEPQGSEGSEESYYSPVSSPEEHE